MANERVQIELTGDEALVLFEWVSRFNKREDVEYEDQAEQRVLWDVEATLEAALVEPFSSEYVQLLTAARARVRDRLE
ncbi:hypothetical protein [Kribbella endophytica]